MNYDSIKKSYNWGCLLFLCSALLLLPFRLATTPSPSSDVVVAHIHMMYSLACMRCVAAECDRQAGEGNISFSIWLEWAFHLPHIFSVRPFSFLCLFLHSFTVHTIRKPPPSLTTWRCRLTLLAEYLGVVWMGLQSYVRRTHTRSLW